MDKTEWPTQERLAALRAEGIVPYSYFSTRCATAFAVLLVLYFAQTAFLEALTLYRNVWAHESPLSSHLWTDIFQVLLWWLFAPALVVLVASFVWGLAQTKFLFHFSSLGFQLGRLNPFGTMGLARFGVNFVATCGMFLVAIAAGALVVFLMLTPTLQLLNGDLSYFLSWPEKVLERGYPPLLGVLGLLALFCWLIARFRFMLKYRMSHAEIERENQERS